MDKYRIDSHDDNDSDAGLNFDFGDSARSAFDDLEIGYAAATDKGSGGNKAPRPRGLKTDLSGKGSGSFADSLKRKRGLETNSVKRAFADKDLIDANENLGDDFYKSVWEPPKVDLALSYMGSQIYQAGEADLSKTVLIDDTQLGIGVNLYFQFAYSMSIALLVMTILSIPVMLFAFEGGDGMPLQQRDIAGFYRLTLGNIGHDRSSFDYAATAHCNSDSSSSSGGDECVSMFGQAVSIQQVALLVTIFEMLQVGVFVAAVLHLQRRLQQLQQRYVDLGIPSITDYAIYVKNIPPDTTTKELVMHFSALYQLQDIDFRDRKPVENVAPVDSSDYSGHEFVIGSWVADCIIGSKVRKFVKYLHRRKALMFELYKARARIKMYSDRTPHQRGAQPKRLPAAHKQLIHIGRRIDKLNAKVRLTTETAAEDRANAKAQLLQAELAHQAAEDKQMIDSKVARAVLAEGSKKPTKEALAATADDSVIADKLESEEYNKYKKKKIAAVQENEPITESQKEKKVREIRPAMAAFVCFEYNESMARCVDDHQLFRYLPIWLFYPQEMKFKERHKLHVVRAPEPDQLLWENLEVSALRKGSMRLLTALASLLFLLLLYALLAAAADYRTQYVLQMPPPGVCPRALPFLFTGGFPLVNDDDDDKSSDSSSGSGSGSSEKEVSEFRWQRAPSGRRADLDAQCSDAVGSGAFYARFTDNNNNDDGENGVQFSIAACSEKFNGTRNAGLCPSIAQSVFCPCLLPDSDEQCHSLGCYNNVDDDFTQFLINSTTTTSAAGRNATGAAVNRTSDDRDDDDDGFNNIGFKDSCVEFTSGDIPKCFCQSLIDRMLSQNGAVGLLSWLFTDLTSSSSGSSGEECYDAVFGYSASAAGVYLLALLAAIAQHLLCDWVAYCAERLELHEMVDELHLAVAAKTFLCSFSSSALLVLLAFGSSTESPSILDDSYIFNGPYTEFDRGWFGTVGFFLVASFFLTVFAPVGASHVHIWCFQMRQWLAVREVRSSEHVKIMTQQQLNRFFVDDSLNIPVRTGKLLSWLFTAMTFAAGTPLLLLFCAAAFVLAVRIDKHSLCRCRIKPRPYGAALARWVLQWLPWAAILRLIIACFMYSSDDIFSSQLLRSAAAGGQPMDTDAYHSSIDSLSDHSSSGSSSLLWLENRLLRYNTFPLFLFFLLLSFIALTRLLWRYLPFYWILRLLHICTHSYISSLLEGVSSSFKVSKVPGFIHPYDLTFGHPDTIRCQEAPLTGGYSKLLRHADDKRGSSSYSYSSENSSSSGCSWCCSYLISCCCCCGLNCEQGGGDRKINRRKWEILELESGFEARIRTWPAKVQLVDGSLKFFGDQKYTYDVISERHCNSFRIEQLPEFRTLGFELLNEMEQQSSNNNSNTSNANSNNNSSSNNSTNKNNSSSGASGNSLLAAPVNVLYSEWAARQEEILQARLQQAAKLVDEESKKYNFVQKSRKLTKKETVQLGNKLRRQQKKVLAGIDDNSNSNEGVEETEEETAAAMLNNSGSNSNSSTGGQPQKQQLLLLGGVNGDDKGSKLDNTAAAAALVLKRSTSVRSRNSRDSRKRTRQSAKKKKKRPTKHAQKKQRSSQLQLEDASSSSGNNNSDSDDSNESSVEDEEDANSSSSNDSDSDNNSSEEEDSDDSGSDSEEEEDDSSDDDDDDDDDDSDDSDEESSNSCSEKRKGRQVEQKPKKSSRQKRQ